MFRNRGFIVILGPLDCSNLTLDLCPTLGIEKNCFIVGLQSGYLLKSDNTIQTDSIEALIVIEFSICAFIYQN
ncbi:hypothetical protein BN1088_1430212 [Sphingobacterium sp. PM2-P1-29]|nr:hypothetical protein BN1088_1430212 [Sphingobacterium sp. PM2-P1-29]